MTRRPPARRRPVVRRRVSRRARQDGLTAALVVGGVILVVAAAAVRWLLEHWWVLLVLGLGVAAAGGVWLYRRVERTRREQARLRAVRYGLDHIDTLHHRDFEYAVRDLMLRDGCPDARQVGGAGDNGVDVIATDPYGRRWVLQCKHRTDGLAGGAVGTPDLQRVNGTARQLHGADVVAVITNGRFSSKCPHLAGALHMHLIDRHLLAQWAAGNRPLWDLLPKIPPPRRPLH